jgi:glycosyltransferase involved in cell wall biosynthesis
LNNINKILFVSHDVNRAGAQLFLLSIMKYFKEKNIGIVLLALNDWGTLRSEFEKEFEVYYINQETQKKSFWSKDTNVIDTIAKEHKIDLVYVNTIASVDLLPQLSSKFNKPIISHIHELQYSISQYGSPKALEILFDYSQKIISCSQAVADNLTLFHRSNKLAVVHSFVENERILAISKASDQLRIRKKYNLEEDKIWICACGNADWRKAPDIFLQIAGEVSKKNERIGFAWIGLKNEGGQYEQLKYDEKKLSLENQIRWIEPTDEAVEIINVCDAFLVSSREDPFPLVVLEAALCSKPIFGFKRTGGVDEFIDENCGFKMDYLSVYQMAEKISKLEKSEMKELGKNAKNKVLENYSFEISIQKIEKLLQNLTF